MYVCMYVCMLHIYAYICYIYTYVGIYTLYIYLYVYIAYIDIYDCIYTPSQESEKPLDSIYLLSVLHFPN